MSKQAHSEQSDSQWYEPPSHQRGAGDGTITLPGRCSDCDCALDEQSGLCVDTLCPGSREDDDAYYRRSRRS